MHLTATRGVRNFNPGNIDYNPRNSWEGQLGLEIGVPNPRFGRFDNAENGMRALCKLLLNYRGKDGMPGVGGPGIDTVRETITPWAPGNENTPGLMLRPLPVASASIPTTSSTFGARPL